MIQTIKISEQAASKLLHLEENHFCDLKAIEVSPRKLTKALAAFSNAEGGDLFIGIDDKPRQWRGFINVEAANSHIQVVDQLFPLGLDYQYEFLEQEKLEGLVLKVQVSKTRDLKVASDQKVYVRRGAQSLPIVDEFRLQSLRRDKGIVSFETELVNCSSEEVRLFRI